MENFHYVQRVPPAFNTNPDQTVAPPAEQPVFPSDNPLLLTMIQDALGSASPSPANLGAAIEQVLQPATGTPPIETYLSWWSAFLAKATGSQPDPAAAALLYQLRADILAYVVAGYEAGVLPVSV